MEDNEIIALYWKRMEQAITETDRKYGELCYHIAIHILSRREDAEECVSDTYLGAWNAMPPHRPKLLSAFISRITRNQALKKYEYLSADKRNPNAAVSLTELTDCLSGGCSPESLLENRRIAESISAFLWKLDQDPRNIFLRRYWYFDTVGEIAQRFQCTPNKISAILYRTRKQLKAYLQQEGIEL